MVPKLIKFDEGLIAQIDAWRSDQSPPPPFSSAVRTLIGAGLIVKAVEPLLDKQEPSRASQRAASALSGQSANAGQEKAMVVAPHKRAQAEPVAAKVVAVPKLDKAVDPWGLLLGPQPSAPGSRLKKKK